MSAADSGAAFCDDRAWCEECLKTVEGRCCPLHPLLPISDRRVLSRARQTLPAMFKLRTVGCNRAALVTEHGVFAKRLVQKQSSFGPAEGNLVDDPAAGGNCGRYYFRVFSSTDKAYKFLDNTNEETCNWMMFVRPAANGNEQNLVAYQHRGGIYMTATKVIRPGEELKFWYAKEYALLIGKDLLSVNTSCTSLPDEVSQLLLSLPTTTDIEPAVTECTPGSGVAQHCYHTQQHTQLSLITGLSLETKVGLRTLRCKSSAAAAADIAGVAVRHQVQRPIGSSSRPDDRIQAADYGRRVAAAHNVVTAASGRDSDGTDDGNDIRRPIGSPSFAGTAASGGGGSGARNSGASGGGCCSPDGGRRTRNKRKGRPKKVTAVGSDRKRRKSSTAAATIARAAEAAATAAATIACPSTTDTTALMGDTAQQQQQESLATQEPQQTPRRQRLRRSQQQRGARQQSLPLKCTECGLEFATRGKLLAHGYVHTGERPFRCGQPGCGKGFSSRFKLVRHELIHQPQKRYRCRVCDKPFSRRDHLNNHLAALHDGNRRAHVCEYCRKSYATLHAYRAHVAYHRALAGELSCAVCLRLFDGREALVAHIKAHAGSRSLKGAAEKRFSCAQCDKRFLTQKDVRRHQVTHTKEKRFACGLCGQCFGRQDHLTRHLKKNHCSAASAVGAAATMLSAAAAAAAAARDGVKLAAATAPTCDILSPAPVHAAAASSSAAGTSGSRATSRLGTSAESIASRQLVTAVHAGDVSTVIQMQQNETPTLGTVAAAAGYAAVSDVGEPAAIVGIGVDGGQTLPPDYLTLSVFPGAVSPGGQHQQYFLFNGYGTPTAGGLLKHVQPGAVVASAADHLPVAWQPIIVAAGPPPAAVVAVAATDSASDGRYCSSATAAAAGSSSSAAALASSSAVPCRARGGGTAALLDCSGDDGCGSNAPVAAAAGAAKGECSMLHSLMPAAAMPDDALLGVVVQRDALDHGTLATVASLSSPENSCIVSGIGGCRTDDLSACAYMEAMKALGGFDACISSAAAIAAAASLGGSPPSIEQIAHAHDGLG